MTARERLEHEADRYRALLDTLRASLLPPQLPAIPGIELAAWFEPAADGEMLLGDFYDAFPLSNGRWGIVVGDVCGHGVEAAKLTSLVRYSLRSAAVHHPDPSAVMSEVDAAISRDTIDPGRFATACYFQLELGDPVRLSYGRAGHPHPIHRDRHGRTRLLDDATGHPLGIVLNGRFTTGTCNLEAGETILVYTDGITECRHPKTNDLLGEAGLLEAIATAPVDASPATLIEHVVQHLRAIAPTFTDDIVLFAVRAGPG